MSLNHFFPHILTPQKFLGSGFHEMINYYFQKEKLAPHFLWYNVKNLIVTENHTYMMFDNLFHRINSLISATQRFSSNFERNI